MNKSILITLAVIFSSFLTVTGQGLKFGHINTTELMTSLPEMKAVQTELEAAFSQKESQLTTMQEDLRKQQEAYMQVAQTMEPAARAQKEKELMELNQKVQNFYALAQQEIQEKEQMLRTPIAQKVKAAIEEVGDENGFMYIFESLGGVTVYQSASSVDVMPLVKAKLGVN